MTSHITENLPGCSSAVTNVFLSEDEIACDLNQAIAGQIYSPISSVGQVYSPISSAGTPVPDDSAMPDDQHTPNYQYIPGYPQSILDSTILERKGIVVDLPSTWPYFDEVYFMMHTFGDVVAPSGDSVQLMHNLMESQMALLIKNCVDIMKRRESEVITHEEVLFLMRRNKVMLKRLLQFLYIQDTERVLLPGFEEYSGTEVLPDAMEAGRVHECVSFLATIERFTGDLQSIFNDKNIIDCVFKRRLERRNKIAKSKAIKDDLKKTFEGRLQKTFCHHFHPPEVFHKWLNECSGFNYEITDLALSIIEFLAIETVAGLVEKVLYMRSKKHEEEKETQLFSLPKHPLKNFDIKFGDTDESEDEFLNRDRFHFMKFIESPFSVSHQKTEDSASKYFSKTELIPKKPLTPHEIQAAFIHYQRPKAISVFMKTRLPYLEKRKINLICLTFPEEEFSEM